MERTFLVETVTITKSRYVIEGEDGIDALDEIALKRATPIDVVVINEAPTSIRTMTRAEAMSLSRTESEPYREARREADAFLRDDDDYGE